MRIQLFSDLHLERNPAFQPNIAPDADVIILAGDIGSYQDGSRLPGTDFGLERFAPALGVTNARVLYVPGNHEYDGLDFDATQARLRTLCAQLGIVWLDREIVTIGHVRFIGTTLWADFDALAAGHDLTRQLQLRNKALRAANYYLSKNTTLRGGEPVLAEGWRELGLDCQAWLAQALTTPFDGTTVAVTHFAPSLLSADPRYGVSPGTAGFCNALDHLFPQVDVWMHGHLHCCNDYTVRGQHAATGQEWACRVVANPLGYLSKGEQEEFRPDLVIEL